MSEEWILRQLRALGEKLKIIFERFLDAPEIIRAWSEGRASLGDRAALITAIVLIVAVAAWVVNFFKAGFWKKLGMLLSAALIVFAAAIALSFFSTAEETPAPESPAVSALETLLPAPEGAAEKAPESAAATPSPTPAPSVRRSEGQYSLARGETDPVYLRTSGAWRLCDDTLSWQVDDELLLQLTRLQSLPGVGRFGVEELVKYSDMACVRLSRAEGSGDERANRRSECVLEICIWPGAKLERQRWYADAPSYISTGEGEGYSVFQNTGGEVLFLEKDAKVVNENGDVVTALCMGRQIGGDVVLIKARAFSSETSEGHTEYTELVPGSADEELQSRLLELERALFDGRIRLLRGLNEQSLAASLPGKLVDAPVGAPSGRGGFTIPCSRLLEMRRSEVFGGIIRLVGPGPKEGEELLYSLMNGAMMYEDVRIDHYLDWREAYENGWLDPDPEMTAFLGCPAVKVDGGWVLDPGDYYSPSAGETMENYYYLSTQVLTPAPTPTPTPEPAPESAPAAEGGEENG